MNAFSGGQVGFSSVQSSGNTVVSDSTHPALMLWGLAAVVAAYLLLKVQIRIRIIGSAGIVRRFLCFFVDLYALVIAESSFLSIIPLVVEAKRTGHFAWSFARNYSVASDQYVLIPLAFIGVLLFPAYIGYALIRGKPTLGEFLTGTSIMRSGDPTRKFDWRTVFKRMFWMSMGAGLWPYTLIRGRDKKGRTWYDRVTDCDVARTEFL